MKMTTPVSYVALVAAALAAQAANAQAEQPAAEQQADTQNGAGDAAAPSGGAPAAGGDVIVTGTRVSGLKASDSPTPIQLLGSDSLQRAGVTDLNSALAQQLPSIQVQTFGTDQAQFHPSIKLRGLSPNHTLVEVNGKRRHGTANVVVSGGAYSGGAAPDLSLIPQDAIDHIEVLQDGAAAQYGTDAIAGVINIILKKQRGITFDATGGEYMDEGGGRYDLMGRVGFEPVENGYISLAAERSYRNFSFRGNVDPRVANTSAPSVVSLLQNYPQTLKFPNYPYVNRYPGDARSSLTNGLYNAGYDISPDVTIYSFGTYSHKMGRANELYRTANAVLGQSPTDVPYPGGFTPQQVLKETDYAATGGIKGNIGDTTFDIASTYGKDLNNIYVDHSINAALYYDKGFSPSLFYAGAFVDTQWSNTLDLTHKFDLGLENPLNVAAGIEYRRESYELRAGDPASYYVSPTGINPVTGAVSKGGGAQSFFGYSPVNASDNIRRNVSEYLDLSVKPVDAWLVDGAVRHEHYSDFGSTTVFKLTTRYDFSPAFAVRGTASTGFRAPTLAEEYYSGINVATNYIAGIFAPNSAGAKSLGLNGLGPEKSTNFSAGIVAHPAPRMSITVDGYYIKIRNRIVQSGSFYGARVAKGVNLPNAITSPAVLTALRAAGIPVDSTLDLLYNQQQTGDIYLQTFVNGVSTATKGVDVTANYSTGLGNLGHVDLSLNANYNATKILKINSPPSGVNQAAQLLDPSAQSTLTDQTPKIRVTANAYWKLGKLSVNLREAFYGKTSSLVSDPTTGAYTDRIRDSSHFITDIEVGFQVTRSVKVSAGANNLFNVYPDKYPQYYAIQNYNNLSSNYVSNLYPTFSPIGRNGGYYYGRLSFNF